ncbi:MAG: TolC family protein [Planctomycetota bacterium]|nr:TolC family protein [Planctomycetota bacterium]
MAPRTALVPAPARNGLIRAVERMRPHLSRRERLLSLLRRWSRLVVCPTLLGLVGCLSTGRESAKVAPDSSEGTVVSTGLLNLEPEELDQPHICADSGRRPHTIAEQDLRPENFHDISLDETIQLALANSTVLRDLGGLVLNGPDRVTTKFEPSIVESDPRFGVQAALSEFDAKWNTTGGFEKNDRAINNNFLGGGTRLFQQDLHTWQTQLQKTAATGTQLTVRNFTDYNANNAPGNFFASAWQSNIEMEFRQPLLQRAGVEFNRIAGPVSTPGFINGVMVARANARISQADFEIGVRDYLSNVSNAYWDLYFAYRDLDARIKARDKSLAVWQAVEEAANRGITADDRRALAEEQYFRFQEEVENALSGKQNDSTRTFNGSSGGTFRGSGGLQVAERRLRLLIGLPITEGQLLRPSDEPAQAELVLDYDASISLAMAGRPELKRQRLRMERRQMELTASKSFLKPTFDAMGRYRWRGFGKDLAGDSGNFGQFNSAWENLGTGNFQEWQLGFELDVPLGFRRAHAAVHQAELLLAREKSVLYEQERQIVHDLSGSLAESERAWTVCQTTLNRYRSAKKLVESLESRKLNDRQTIEQLDRRLDAQRRLSDAESRYFLARTEYEVAIKNVYFEQGALLQYHQVATVDAVETGKDSNAKNNATSHEVAVIPAAKN